MCGMYLTSDVSMLDTLRSLNSRRASTAVVNEHVYGDITVGHFRAKTSGNTNITHPSVIDNTHLYHNGIIKNTTLLKHRPDDYKTAWDTAVLHSLILSGFSSVGEIDGSFACFYVVDNTIKFFRNHLSPLWVDTTNNRITLSSVKFNEVCTMVSAGTVYVINPDFSMSVDRTFDLSVNPFNCVLK